MVRYGEGFFTSLGFAPLPKTFWERSLFTKPADRDVVCHASAWDVDSKDDLRVKMCIQITAEDFVIIHHELGHNFYQRAYNTQPPLFQNSANDGFHEAVGDTIALSVTPEYLKTDRSDRHGSARVGRYRLPAPTSARESRVPAVWSDDRQMALGSVLRSDQARSVQQSVVGPAAEISGRGAAGRANAKLTSIPARNIMCPANVPYMRVFPGAHLSIPISARALPRSRLSTGRYTAARFTETKKQGKRLNEMLALGSSKPWQEALETLTGEKQMDATRARRLLRAAESLARRAKQDPPLRNWLVVTSASAVSAVACRPTLLTVPNWPASRKSPANLPQPIM